MNKSIIKTAFISSKKGREKELRESLREVAHKTRAEKGCKRQWGQVLFLAKMN